jgi:hypothetical protein
VSELPPVTDHALLRFLERGAGIDLNRVRREMAQAAATGVRHGARIVIFGGAKLVIRGGAVVTALPRNGLADPAAGGSRAWRKSPRRRK